MLFSLSRRVFRTTSLFLSCVWAWGRRATCAPTRWSRRSVSRYPALKLVVSTAFVCLLQILRCFTYTLLRYTFLFQKPNFKKAKKVLTQIRHYVIIGL